MLSCFSHVRLHSAMDCSPPSPSVHGICQARILEWIAMPSSRGASQPRDWTLISMSPALAVVFFTTSATWRLSTKILMLSNCGVGEDSWVPWTTRKSNQSVPKEINPEYSLGGLMLKLKLQCLATWFEDPTHLKRPWCWERLRVGEAGGREWDGWIASPTQWTWVWANSERERRTRKFGVLQSMGSQRVRYNVLPEQQQQ